MLSTYPIHEQKKAASCVCYVLRFTMSSTAHTPGAEPESPGPSSTRVPKKRQPTLNREYFSKNPVTGASQLGAARPPSPPRRGPGRPKRPRTENAAAPEPATTASTTAAAAAETPGSITVEQATPGSVTVEQATELVPSASAPTCPTAGAATSATKHKKVKIFKYLWVSKVSFCSTQRVSRVQFDRGEHVVLGLQQMHTRLIEKEYSNHVMTSVYYAAVA